MRRIIALSLLFALGTSCMTAPKPVSAPAAYIEVKRPAQVWVERKDGSTVLLEKPRIFADSLYGLAGIPREELWMAVADARTVRVRQLDGRRTALLVGGLVLVGGTVMYMLAGTGRGIDQTELDRPENVLIPRGIR